MQLIIINALLWDQKVLNWRDLEIIKGAGLVLRPTTVEAEVSFSEQGAARQPLLLDSHRWQGIFQNDYTAFAIGMTDSIAAAMLPELPHTACQSGHLAITSRSNKGSLESRISSFK